MLYISGLFTASGRCVANTIHLLENWATLHALCTLCRRDSRCAGNPQQAGGARPVQQPEYRRRRALQFRVFSRGPPWVRVNLGRGVGGRPYMPQAGEGRDRFFPNPQGFDIFRALFSARARDPAQLMEMMEHPRATRQSCSRGGRISYGHTKAYTIKSIIWV